ncbi:hypothetical protein SESBI_24696 [Sesbania bispinosa]|nr:hypothetical protein SESBI_24696 [Sesbania bispinosa]
MVSMIEAHLEVALDETTTLDGDALDDRGVVGGLLNFDRGYPLISYLTPPRNGFYPRVSAGADFTNPGCNRELQHDMITKLQGECDEGEDRGAPKPQPDDKKGCELEINGDGKKRRRTKRPVVEKGRANGSEGRDQATDDSLRSK